MARSSSTPFCAVLLPLLLLRNDFATARIPSGIGPFRVQLHAQSECPATEKCSQKIAVSRVQVTRDPSKPYKFTYNAALNMTVPVDDNYHSEIRVSRWNSLGGGWTNNVFRMDVPNICSTAKRVRPDMFQQLVDAIYRGEVSDCPLHPIQTDIKDLTIEAKPPSKVRQLPYGRYRARTKLIDGNQECVLCHEVITDVLPKK